MLSIKLQADDAIATYCRDISAEFGWLRLGKIESITIEHKGIKIYMLAYKKGQDVHLLNSSLENINYMVRSEEIKNISDFITTDLGDLISYLFLSTDEDLLDKTYFRSYAEQSVKTADQKVDINVRLMERYCTGVSTKIKNDTWALSFNTIEKDGKVKIWGCRGKVDPFSVTELSIRVGNKGKPLPTITYVRKP